MRQSKREQVVCPKCKGTDLYLVEVSEAYEIWKQDAEGNIVAPAKDEPQSFPVLRVEARCQNEACGHIWTVRGVANVTELPNWPKEGDEAEAVEETEAPVVAQTPVVTPTPVEKEAKDEDKSTEVKTEKKGRGRPKKAA